MKVFMSHSGIDKPFVERLAGDLRTRESIDAWLDKWEILPGDRIATKLEEALSSASIFLLILSPESVNSKWVSYEKDVWLTQLIEEEIRAKQESRTPNRRLIPVLYKDCEKPAFIKPLLYVSINDHNYENGFQQLVRGIRGESGKPPLGGKTNAEVIYSSPQQQSSLSVVPKKLAFNLLKILLVPQFLEVVFLYDMESSYLPTNVSQIEKISVLINYALQKEGNSLSDLLKTIYEVAPHLKR
ncbi:toll/interleukin-1 receptor domain-containing protein [Dolichospermum sp. UHCC 0352]|uniref:toll/interleukin-1 receptor domain-containing protein n=1 Tax=Dolichospermum sp. UHCC 0352 TaxID=2590011 RepID=UPI001446093F|nr:toll/interleukin-1 receptor domain-containing protein [Dolichospermum sp. UHCC 0352]MTJ21809.1 toll/interleukin-1 receptor domain-containing protein [Dolichospermum sp. UHCC 0352]